MKKFLWSIFVIGIKPLFALLAMKAAATATKVDDVLVEYAEKVGEIFIPGTISSDGSVWDIPPVTDLPSKGIIVRNVSSVMIKKMFTDSRFLRMSRLSEEQAGTTLVAAMSYLRPESVDTVEERKQIMDEVAEAFITNPEQPIYEISVGNE